MKTTFTAFIATAFVIIIISSCEQQSCPGFDTDHDMMNWYFVPGLDAEVNYVDTNGTSHVFNLTAYNASEAYIEKCGGFHKCQCYPPRLNTTYYNSTLDMNFSATTSYYFGTMLSVLQDTANYALEVDLANDYVYTNDTAYTVKAIDTFNIFNSTYVDVFEIDAPNESFKFWLKKHNGMVAFEKNSIRYKLN